MSTIEIQPGDLILKDPASSQIYQFSWDRLTAGAEILTSTFSIRAVNAAGQGDVLAVASAVYIDPVLTITTVLDHGYSTGDSITLSGALPVAFNGTYVVDVTGTTSFDIGLGGFAPLTSTSGMTVARGIDELEILVDPPSNSRYTQFRFTGGTLGAVLEIANRIVTSETPAQIKERSFRILIENL